jgi:Tol biopolymer transport system component
VGLVLASCQGGGSSFLGAPAPSPDPSGQGRALFAIAGSAGIFTLDAYGQPLGYIVRATAGTSASSPTLDPSGKAIVFVLAHVADAADLGADVYRVNLDGTDLRPVVRHEARNVFYASPTFDRSNGSLYVHRRAENAANLQRSTDSRFQDTIERIDLASGERRTVVNDAAEPTVSPDGKTLVFVHISRGDQDGLWSAATDGHGAGPFFKTRDTFSFLQAPRISPSGREIVLCSAGHLVTRPETHEGMGSHAAHLGVPSELYIAPIDGTGVRSIAMTSDDVVPAWSPDGTRVAYVAVGTLFVVSVADGAVKLMQRISATYGDPVWLR